MADYERCPNCCHPIPESVRPRRPRAVEIGYLMSGFLAVSTADAHSNPTRSATARTTSSAVITFPKGEDVNMQFANKEDEKRFDDQLMAVAEKLDLLGELETQHGIRSAEDFDRWWRETKGNWEREIALLKSQLIQAHHLNVMKMEEFMQQFTLECVKVAPAKQKAVRMEKALLAIKEIVGDREYPDECGWDTFDQIRDALNEGLKEDNDVQEG